MKRHLSDKTQAQLDAIDSPPYPRPDYDYIESDPMLRGLLPQKTDQEPK